MTQPPPTILYIDDDATLARLVERGLKRQGFNVVHAADGTAVVENGQPVRCAILPAQ